MKLLLACLMTGFAVAMIIGLHGKGVDEPLIADTWVGELNLTLSFTPSLLPNLTTAPTPVPTPTPAPLSEKDKLIAQVHDVFPDDPRMGDVVVWEETLRYEDGVWQEYVHNGAWSVSGDCGLMQINWYYHSDKFIAHGWGVDDCFDPVKNLVVAREIYDTSGPYAWSTY